MDIALDEVLHFDAITSHPSTGAATDADSTPTWEVFEEDTDTAIGSGNFTKRTSKTGNYRGTHTLSSANGYEVGKWYTVVASATVNSVAGKGIVQRFRIVPAESTAGVPRTDVTHFGGTAGTFASGRPEVSNVVGTVSGAVGSISGVTFPSNFSSLAITGGGAVTAGTVSDKTGYSISGTTTTLDALQTALNSAHGSGSWATATGFSTHSAADVWAVGTRTITGGTISTVSDKTGYSLATAPPTAAAIADAVWDEAQSGHVTAGTFGYYLDAQVSDVAGGGGTIVIDTNGVNALVNALLAQGPTLYNALTADQTTLRIADEYVWEFTGLGDISARTDVVFALKTRVTDADSAALILVSESTGLERLNGASTTAGNGSITVDDEVAGDITVRISSAATASLTVGKRQDCVKVLISGGNDITKRAGITNVIAGVVTERA